MIEGKGRCPICKGLIRMNEHHVLIQHNMIKTFTIVNGKKVAGTTEICKGSFKKLYL